MLWIISIVGAGVGWALTDSPLGAVAGTVVALVTFMAAQYVVGTRSVQEATKAVPVDLAAGTPATLTAENYVALPLASRNAVVARLVAGAAGRSVVDVADLLPGLMGRTRVQTEAKLRATQALAEESASGRIDSVAAKAVCAGEVLLAARAATPPNDRARAALERNMDAAADEGLLTKAVLASRLPRIDLSVGELIDLAVSGRVDLAFVVGTIRKVGEFHAREMAKLR